MTLQVKDPPTAEELADGLRDVFEDALVYDEPLDLPAVTTTLRLHGDARVYRAVNALAGYLRRGGDANVDRLLEVAESVQADPATRL